MTLQQNGLRIWDWRNEVALPWSEQLPLAIDAAMSPDGTSIAALFNTGEVTLLDPSSGNVLQNLQPAEGMISVNWSPDGQRLAVTGRRLQIWNVSSEPKLESDWSHPATITGVRFSRSGQQIVSCSEDNWRGSLQSIMRIRQHLSILRSIIARELNAVRRRRSSAILIAAS